MRKKILSLALCVSLIMSVFACMGAVNASAEKYGDFEYSVKYDGTIEITKYTGSDADVEIPSKIGGISVTEIGYEAFYGCTSLESVTIPDSVTEIGWGAFSGCTDLKGVTIPDSVTWIDGAFQGCTSLESVTIPDSVIQIGECAFEGCTSLESITIPDSVTGIGGSAFYDCTSLESITIPDSVTGIGGSTFANCTSLESITIPDSVTGIAYYAFENCTSLKSITIPDSVTWIGHDAFHNTAYYNNKSNWENGALYIGKYLISGKFCDENYNYTTITEVKGDYKIKNGTKLIADSAFEDCTNLEGITIPDSVTSIGYTTFRGCTSLKSVTIPDGAESIGMWAFDDCTSLKSITIPDSVTYIGHDAFYNTAYYNNKSNWENNVLYIGKYLISGKMTFHDEEYNYTTITEVKGDYEVKDGTKLIADYAFENCTSLKSITIPNSVTSIGISAFEGCTSLEDVTIPDSVTIIGWDAFYGCGDIYIYANAGSYAIEYAKENNIKYVDLTNIIYGDADGNGEVDFKDVMLMRKKYANWDVPYFNKKNADCNADDKFDSKDVLLLRKSLAHWDVKLGPQ